MKAVVVELKNDFAAVLSDDGCIKKIKNNHYEIGQIIKLKNPGMRFSKKASVFAASAAAAFVLIGTGTLAYASPYTYVSMDVNPSIEFTVNRFDRVLRVKAVNDDGEDLIDKISLSELKNKTIEDALSASVDQISELGYFDGTTEGGIVIATSSKNMQKADELAQELQQTLESRTADLGDTVEVEAFSVGLNRVEKANDLGVTPGKLNLVEELQEAATDPDSINLEEWLDKPVKDIMKATKELKSADSNNKSASKEAAAANGIKKNVQDQASQNFAKNAAPTDPSNTQNTTKGSSSESGNGSSDISKEASNNSDKANNSANTAKASGNNANASGLSKNKSSADTAAKAAGKGKASTKLTPSAGPVSGTSTKSATINSSKSTGNAVANDGKSVGNSSKNTGKATDSAFSNANPGNNSGKSDTSKTQGDSNSDTGSSSEKKSSNTGSIIDNDNKTDSSSNVNDRTSTGPSGNSSATNNSQGSHESSK